MTTADEAAAVQSPHASAAAWRLKPWQELAILFFVPFLLNIQSLGFDLLYVDDFEYYANPALHGGRAQGLIDIWRTTILSDYSPVTQLTIWLDVALFGTGHWWGARLHEIAWFGCGTLALFFIALRLTANRQLAFWTALLYALHPVCAQSNLWLAERKSLVALALSLWAVERYICARQRESLRAALPPAIAAFFLTAAALLAKPHAAAIIAMLAAYELCLARGRWTQRIAWLIPIGLINVAFVVLSLQFLRTDLDRERLGGSLPAAVLGDGPILLRYLWNTVYPLGLTLYYAVAEPTLQSLRHYGAWALVLAIVALTVFLARRRALVLFGWMFALAALGPAINLVPQLAPMTDHYHQWALPGLLLVVCVLAQDRLDLCAENPKHRGGLLLVGGLALFWAIISFARVPEFTNYMSFFEASVLKEPDSAMNWAIYCNALRADADPRRREQAGLAGLRALKCADAGRLIDSVRIGAIQEAAFSYHRAQKTEDGWAFAKKECAKLVDANESRIVLAEIALGIGKTRDAIALLDPDTQNNFVRAAVKTLREQCRSGEKMPHELSPLVQLAGANPGEKERSTELLRRSLVVLADAYLKSNDLEHAFDCAAVAVNIDPSNIPARKKMAEVYLKLRIPGAVERLAPKK